ncbi:MAG: GNAT family N-acetyltransferase [Candidatus Marinimicrobia bacterium]|nr:GNAT family N-acetyltransferase [Candidatus Neomarinimicrobiota bacterium]
MNEKPSRTFFIRPLTPETWSDFETLFGANGACGGCWCRWWQLTNKEFEAQKGEGNRRAMQAAVREGQTPGLLAYHEEEPVGWVAVEPRKAYPRLARSKILRPLDDEPVWSVVCQFVTKGYRRQGVSIQLLLAAADYVRKQGGRMVEGYAVEPKKSPMPPVFAFYGLAAAFRAAGYKEVVRRSETRPIMRKEVG